MSKNQRWRRLSDVIARTPDRIDGDVRWLGWHIPELSEWRWATRRIASTASALGAGADVTIRWLRKNQLGRRVWLCGVACMDGVAFMVFQNGGREGDDVTGAWVVDEALYVEAVRRLSGRSRPRVPEVCDPRWRYPDLGRFYGHDLDEVGSTFNMDLCVSPDDDPFFAAVSHGRDRVLHRMQRRDALAKQR